MKSWLPILNKFLLQVKEGSLKTSSYPKSWGDLNLKVSFGMGSSARVPWLALITDEMAVSKGFYPVYLYYKELGVLILAYGVSETAEFGASWPDKIMDSTQTVSSFFDTKIPRYGTSLVYKAYKVDFKDSLVRYLSTEDGSELSSSEVEQNFQALLNYYKKVLSIDTTPGKKEITQGLFYMEKELENFIIRNWESTELGKKYNLIVEEGVLKSQQYRTDVGPIDILARDKKTSSYVVIELKKNQTSDDTVGQLTRYMGWVKSKLKDSGVVGIIIAGQYDKKLEYAISTVPNAEVFVYTINFTLAKQKK